MYKTNLIIYYRCMHCIRYLHGIYVCIIYDSSSFCKLPEFNSRNAALTDIFPMTARTINNKRWLHAPKSTDGEAPQSGPMHPSITCHGASGSSRLTFHDTSQRHHPPPPPLITPHHPPGALSSWINFGWCRHAPTPPPPPAAMFDDVKSRRAKVR